MKKTLIGILFLISIFYCYGVDFECNVSEHSLIKYSKTPGEGVDNPYKDTKITASTDDIIYGEPDYLMVKSKNKYYIDVNSLSLQNNQNILNELFINKRWIPEYCYKALYNSTYNYIFDYEGNIEKLYNSGEIDYEIGTDMESISSHNINNVINNMRWYNYIDIPFLEREGNITVKYNVYKNSLSFLYCYVTEITESSVTLYINTIYNPYKQNKVLNNLFEDEIITLEYKIDGDYLYLYRNKKLIYTFINASDSFIAEYKKFLNHKVISIDNIIWPHHENGSCDYNRSIKSITSQTAESVSLSIISQNKIMLVNENLKLRSGEATTSEVLTVMSAGTKVKILALGKEENIDGINSNWVKVEVQAGAKDRDGKPIKAGTIGWCYGGYLK